MGVIQAPAHDPDHQNGIRLEDRAALDAPEVWPDALLEKSEHLLAVVTQLSTVIGVDDREFALGTPSGGIPQRGLRTNEVAQAPHSSLGRRGPSDPTKRKKSARDSESSA